MHQIEIFDSYLPLDHTTPIRFNIHNLNSINTDKPNEDQTLAKWYRESNLHRITFTSKDRYNMRVITSIKTSTEVKTSYTDVDGK